MGASRRLRRPARRGMTPVEVILVVLLLSILLIAICHLLEASWQSYENLWWQNRVNATARQALDDLCDTLRMGGYAEDLLAPQRPPGQVDGDTYFDPSRTIGFYLGDQHEYYQVRSANGISYLIYGQDPGGAGADAIAPFIKEVRFEYEYRLPADGTDSPWQFVRVGDPTGHEQLIRTVYVTVTAETPPVGLNGQVYRRTLTSAVQLRGPYNLMLPSAVNYP
jgi:hypothetical protein